MPYLEVSMPKVDRRTKELLSARLTETFTACTGFAEGTLGIRYLEYEVGGAANGGQLWDGRTGKPYLHLVFYSPRLRHAEKQKLVEAMTMAFVECLGKPQWKPVIFISEYPYENVGVNGELLSEVYEDGVKREFYYHLPDD